MKDTKYHVIYFDEPSASISREGPYNTMEEAFAVEKQLIEEGRPVFSVKIYSAVNLELIYHPRCGRS